MRMMRLAVPLLLLALPDLAVARVRSDHDPEARFEGRQTFAWRESEGLRKFREDEPFLDKYLRAAIEAELLQKGLRRVEEGPADLQVTYRAAVRQRLEVYDDPDWYPRRSWCDDDVELRAYDEVTYSVDVSDGASGELMWRGWASEPQAREGRTRQQVDRLMKRLFRKYPPR